MFKDFGIFILDFVDVQFQVDFDVVVVVIGLLVVFKICILGYDGKGQKVLCQLVDVQGVFVELGSVLCIFEGFVLFIGEVLLVVVCVCDGEMCFYLLVYNIYDSGIFKFFVVSSVYLLQVLVEDYVGCVLVWFDYVGVLVFEFFEVDGGLKVNEIVLCVYNFGYWIIEGVECSQFENYLCVVVGLLLGLIVKVGESVMFNFIGVVFLVVQVVVVVDCYLYYYGKVFKNGCKVGYVILCCVDWVMLQVCIVEVEVLIEV